MDSDAERILVIDAKDWNRAADISDVEQFAGLARDVGATRSLLLCNRGSLAGPATMRENLGIELYNLLDAEFRGRSRD